MKINKIAAVVVLLLALALAVFSPLALLCLFLAMVAVAPRNQCRFELLGASTIGALWIPAIWIPAMRERQATFPVLWNSGIVARADLFDAIASGPGTSANAPFLNDITDQTDEVQVENAAPVNNNQQPGAVQIFPLCNRVIKKSSTALAKQLSGIDPMTAIIDQLVENRLKNRQFTLVAMLRGLFASAGVNLGAGAAGGYAAGALDGVKLTYNGQEPFIENGAAAGAAQLFIPDFFIDAKALMGELGDLLKNGCFFCHPNIRARLEKLDALNFKTVDPGLASALPFSITTYRDVPIFTSVLLARPGTQGGYVYDSYLIARGMVGYGEQPQQGDTTAVASLQYWRDRDLNNELIWDRTRFMLGVNGTKWVGAAANVNNGPANAELQVPGNWQLVFQSANRVGAVCIRTNG